MDKSIYRFTLPNEQGTLLLGKNPCGNSEWWGKAFCLPPIQIKGHYFNTLELYGDSKDSIINQAVEFFRHDYPEVTVEGLSLLRVY